MKTINILRETYKAIEHRIAERITEIEREGYEVDPWELDEIRADAYAEFGWEYEPDTEEEEEIIDDPNNYLEYSILSGREFM